MNDDNRRDSTSTRDQARPALSARPLIIVVVLAVFAVLLLRGTSTLVNPPDRRESQDTGVATLTGDPADLGPGQEKAKPAPSTDWDQSVMNSTKRRPPPVEDRRQDAKASTKDAYPTSGSPAGSSSNPFLPLESQAKKPPSRPPPPARKELPPEPKRAEPKVPEWQATLDELAREYGVEIVYRGTIDASSVGSNFSGEMESADPSHLVRYAPALAAELSRYPAPVIKKTKLKRIVLCKNLSVGLQPRAGIAILDEHTLCLDVAACARNERHGRLAMHHEIFHLIDQADDGSLDDPEWRRLNPSDFHYRKGSTGVSDDPTVLFSRSAPDGFVSKYATVDEDEDKAETFAHLMTDPDALAARASSDTCLADKVRRLEGLLAEFSGGERFWEISTQRDSGEGRTGQEAPTTRTLPPD